MPYISRDKGTYITNGYSLGHPTPQPPSEKKLIPIFLYSF